MAKYSYLNSRFYANLAKKIKHKKMKKTISILFFVLIYSFNSFAQSSVMDFYNSHLATLQQTAGNTDRSPTFKKKDITNGFLSYDLMNIGIMGWEEMAYFTAKNGKKFVAIVSYGCGPLCGCGLPTFYELQNGALVDKTEQYLPKSTQEQITQAIWQSIDNDKSKSDNTVPVGMWVKLPQIGTTIEIGKMEGMMEGGKLVVMYELQYEEQNGTFKLVKK